MQKKESKRQLILQAALQTFVEEGYERATIQKIAQRAGVGKGTTYEYFPSKETLFSEVVYSGIETVIDELVAELKKPGTVSDRIQRLYEKNVIMFQSKTELKDIMLNEMGKIPKEVHDKLMLKQLEIVQLTEQIISDGIDQGELRADIDPRVAASVILHGLKVIYTFVLKEDEPLIDIANKQSQLIMRGLLAE
ncbi:TetR/AcrR family transcriptional regulator [Bacillus solitudinis]|uniref:TetR/AcrR family transcriptional regulator n=1 Tax=Bacillus solitudinis TaxID=2014074 RepID=UPI0018E1F7EC|nr:TetR/AcrR family transcriptional regulator [Bacillus solitudinis]